MIKWENQKYIDLHNDNDEKEKYNYKAKAFDTKVSGAFCI